MQTEINFVLGNNGGYIDLWLVSDEGNVIVRLFSEPFSVSSEAIVFLVDSYY